ncbi:MAG: AAA family ATPase [Planctomycetota bacterium]|jgi:hypothetical protein|nr:AAA family ATPase [Planctomycetota bacterium]
MKLVRLRIANFRGVRKAEVNFAGQGVTLVQGSNETGKTSLKDSIRLLFKYKDNSAHADIRDLRPVGEDVGPEIELEARAGDLWFVYRKVFLKDRKTELRLLGPEEKRLAGTPAHEEAERILNESLDRDLWDALGVDQGEGALQPDLAGCKPLMEALDRASGGGGAYDGLAESLFGKVRQEYLKYYTPTGKEGRDLVLSAATFERVAFSERTLGEAVRALEDQAARTENLRKTLVDMHGRRAELSKERDRRRAELDIVERLEREIADGGLELMAAAGQLAAAERLIRERDRLIGEEKGIAEELDAVNGTLAPIAAKASDSEARLGAARSRLEETKTARDLADLTFRLRHRDSEYYDDLLRLDSMKKRKTRFDESLRRAEIAAEELDRNPVTRELVERIAKGELEVAKLEGRLEAENPRVRVRGLGDGRIVLNGEDVIAPAGEPLVYPVRGDMRIVVPGKVEIVVEAGTVSPDLAKTLENAGIELAALLAAGRVSGLEAAYAALDRREKAVAALANHDQIAAECLADLSYGELTARIESLEKTLPAYPENRGDLCEMASGLDAARKARDEAEKEFRDTDLEYVKARDAHDSARESHETLRRSQVDGVAEAGVLRKRLDRIVERLNAARAEVPDETLEDAFRAAEDKAKRHDDRLKARTASLAEKDPENVRLLFNTSVESLDSLLERQKAAEKELVGLESAMEATGDRGVFEELQEAAAATETARLADRALRRRAEAARLLHETVARHRDRMRKRYVLPLKNEVERLGRMIFGSTFKVTIDDADLSITDRTLEGRTVAFRQLSGGAKEQLALVYRAACSTMAGVAAPPVILDDALGYTDPQRLLAMGAVLAKVARETQVVIFTCIPDRYRNIGDARIVELP